MSEIIENVWAMQNELRNKEGITGMDAMHHVLMVMLSKSFTIEQCQKLNIPEEYAFENMIQLNKTDLFNKFYSQRNSQNCIVRYIRQGDMFGYTKDLPFQIRNESTLEYMFHRVNKISNEELMNSNDVIGDIYEHFINREGKTMKDLGQYFTDRSLISYLVNMINPRVFDNGQIPTIWDPAAGTGGFLIEYIHQLNQKHKGINWNLNKTNIYANDINKNTYCLLKQNLYYSLKETTGITIKLLDSLVKDDDQMYDFILANPPFGIKGLKYKDMNSKIKELGINGTKGEILFLQLCMCRLNKGGKCCIVVPEGVLFNSTKMYTETRKYLLENFNLKKIIKVGEGDFFKNTGVRTSILYFENSGKTDQVEFVQVNKVDNSINEEPLISIKVNEIIENGYSLNINLYKKVSLDVNKEYTIVSLGDISSNEDYNTSNKSIVSKDGEYKYFTSSKSYKNCDVYTEEGEYIIKGTHGNIENTIHYINGRFSCGNNILKIKIDTKVNAKYVYYFLKLNKKVFEYMGSETIIKFTSYKELSKCKIVLPSLEIQNSIVKQLDNIYEIEIEASKKLIISLKESIKTIMENTIYCDNLQEYTFSELYNDKPKKNRVETDEQYPKYQSGGIIGNFNYYEYDNKYILFGRKGCVGNPQKINGKFSINENVFIYDINEEKVRYEYMYNHLKYILEYEKYIVGATMPGISYLNMSKYKIKIPSIDVQDIIISKVLPKEVLIDELEKNIQCAENEAKDIMDILFN